VPLDDPEFKEQLAASSRTLRAFGPVAVGQPRPWRRSGPGNAAEGVGPRASASRPAPTARLDLHHPAQLFLSQMRRARFQGEWDESPLPRFLAAPASQDRHIELGDMQRALLHLPPAAARGADPGRRGGFAYEEAADICGCAVGTIKSRVGRVAGSARGVLTGGKLPSRRQHKTDSQQVGASDDHGRSR
jgi:RNA polymerase sigma-70 factor (ECF subfamily)